MLKVTDAIVEAIATELITQNGGTTTLEVKNALRGAGFFAQQQDVSDRLRELAEKQNKFSFTDNGTFRRYIALKVASAVRPVPVDGGHRMEPRSGRYGGPEAVCVGCGCSKEAIDHFGWKCRRPQTSNFATGGVNAASPVQTPLLASQRGLMITTVPVTPVVATKRGYRVTDRSGWNIRYYQNVTRGTAKNRWARDTGRDFFEARATQTR
jgi:hypothetical protein